MLAIIPAGESPVGGISPVATVVIPGDGKGDQLVESPEVKVSVREASNSTGRSEGEWLAPKACLSEVPNPCTMGEGQRRRRRNWAQVVDELPGVVEGDMSRRNGLRKHGTTRGSPRRSRTAKASCITGPTGKSRRACEWGGWGRQATRDWDTTTQTGARTPGAERQSSLEWRCSTSHSLLTSSRSRDRADASTKGGGKPDRAKGMPGAGLTGLRYGKASSERASLEAVLGKTRRTEFQGGRRKRRHHSKPGPRLRPTRPTIASRPRHIGQPLDFPVAS